MFEDAVKEYEKLWVASYDHDVERVFAQKYTTIKESMLDQVAEKGEDPFIYHGDQVITRFQADKEACKLANGLSSKGIERGDCVSILVSNRPEVIYSFMACYKAGFVAAGFNPRCTAPEIVKNVGGIMARALVIEREHFHKVLPDLEQGNYPFLKCVVLVDGEGERGEGLPVYSYEEFVGASSDAEPLAEVRPDDNAILLFTGGTTGVSKGCFQTHGAMVGELETMHHWVRSSLVAPDPKVLICMPMTHIMGINYGINWQVINGGSTVISPSFKPEGIIEAFNTYKPTMWATLPTLLHSVSGEGEALSQSAYQDLELIIFGGSFIALKTIEDLMAKTDAQFVESYGMSESFGFVSCNPVESEGKPGSIGLPISNTDMLIVDPVHGTEVLEPYERGEIIFRGPQIIREYWNNPEETALALREGWLYSGDIGFMDDQGFFYLVDRKKDMIVVSGFNVYPKEIDELLIAHPVIFDACTIGVPDDHSGERPKSFIVLKEGFELEEQEVVAYCRETLVAYKVPKYLEFVAEIPKTKAKKPNRKLLKLLSDEKNNEKQAKTPLDSKET